MGYTDPEKRRAYRKARYEAAKAATGLGGSRDKSKNAEAVWMEQKRAAEEKERMERLAKSVKIAAWQPYPHQQRILDYLNAGKKVLLLQGANRIGKTVCGACIVGSACYGQQPWDGRSTVWGNRPVRVRIICVDWEHHAKEVVVPVLREWLPAGTYETRKNNTGVDAYWIFPNG